MPGTFPGSDGQVPTRLASDSGGWVWDWAKLRETGGPTTLTPGAIADGAVLKRSGTTIVGQEGITTTGEANKLAKTDAAGRIRLGADPSNVLDAATKQYVDGRTLTKHIWVNAQNMRHAGDGTAPTVVIINSQVAVVSWIDANNATMLQSLIVPEDYSSGALVVKLWWTNLGSNSGNVVWQVTMKSIADAGDLSLASGATSASDAIAAPSQNILKVSTHSISLAPTAGHHLRLAVVRLGNDAADTLTNAAGLLGVEIEYIGKT